MSIFYYTHTWPCGSCFPGWYTLLKTRWVSYYLLSLYHVLIYTQHLVFMIFYKLLIVSILEMKKLRFKEFMLLVNRHDKWQRKVWWIDPFITTWRPSPSLIVVFVLKATLSDINIATLSSFTFMFVCMMYLFTSFYFQPTHVIVFGVSFLWTAYISVVFFSIHSAHFCD